MATLEIQAPASQEAVDYIRQGCKPTSWSPTVYNFYGDADAIVGKLDGAGIELDERRVYALLLQGESDAEVRFFERVDRDNWAVLSWRGSDLGRVFGRLDEVIRKNRGIHCVGEQVKALLTTELALEPEGMVTAPGSAEAAFGDTVRSHGGDFMRATTALLC
jgi:hypothetical protein